MKWAEGEFRGGGGVRIWYQSWRPEAPRAILALAHGLGEHGGRYGNVVAEVVPRGYAVYALDHRGHGRSDGRRGHVESFAEYIADLGRLIEIAAGECPGLPAFLLGHSLGGTIALRYALERPEGLRGVIASSPLLRMRLGVPPSKRLLGNVMSRLYPTFTQRSGLPAEALSRDPEVVAAYTADPLVHDLVSARLFTEMLTTAEAVLARAPELRLPCLLLVSGADAMVDPQASQELHARLGSADKTLHLYEGFYHEGLNEVGRERPLADLVSWLEAHLAGPARP